jgi:callose synthase
VNDQGVTPLYYLTALHGQEWANLRERLGVTADADVWRVDGGERAVCRWASLRGQTLHRTVRGVMEYARAWTLLAAADMTARVIADTAPDRRAALPLADIQASAQAAAEWLVRRKFSYICCVQRYSERGADDVSRRAAVDALLAQHPLLRVAYFDDAPVHPATAAAAPSAGPDVPPTATYSVCIVGNRESCAAAGGGDRACTAAGHACRAEPRYRFPLPGAAIRDGITEGKPTNQDNGAPFATGCIVQVLDMNQVSHTGPHNTGGVHADAPPPCPARLTPPAGRVL